MIYMYDRNFACVWFIAKDRRRPAGPLISNVEVNNIGSAAQAGFAQWTIVKTVIKNLCFFTQPNLIPKQNYIVFFFYQTTDSDTSLSYQVSSVQLVAEKRLEVLNKA